MPPPFAACRAAIFRYADCWRVLPRCHAILPCRRQFSMLRAIHAAADAIAMFSPRFVFCFACRRWQTRAPLRRCRADMLLLRAADDALPAICRFRHFRRLSRHARCSFALPSSDDGRRRRRFLHFRRQLMSCFFRHTTMPAAASIISPARD